MTRKRKLYDKVKKLLETFPNLRNSDRELMWVIWTAQGITNFGGTQAMKRSDFIKKATLPESIRRARQLVQVDYPNLGPNEAVKRGRKLVEAQKGTHAYREKYVVYNEDGTVTFKYKSVDTN